MGRLPSNHRKYQISILQNSHREIIRQTALGRKRPDVAAELGVSTATVSNVVNSELGRAQMEAIQGGRDESTTDIAKKIQDL